MSAAELQETQLQTVADLRKVAKKPNSLTELVRAGVVTPAEIWVTAKTAGLLLARQPDWVRRACNDPDHPLTWAAELNPESTSHNRAPVLILREVLAYKKLVEHEHQVRQGLR